MKTTKNNHSWCVNPYINISIHPKGIIKPCCMSDYVYHTDNQSEYLNQESVLNFWNSKSRQKLISDLEQGIQVPECNRCWKEELAGKESKRIRDNATYEYESLEYPLVMDLSLGNTCNLKCRICKPIHSSQWMIEEASIMDANNPKTYLRHPQWKISKESFTEGNFLFWNDIKNLLPNVKKLDFAGGEPFYVTKHWDIVTHCVETDISKNQHIHYNTNGTLYPEKYMSLLENFNIVDIQISSDGIGRKFEYMRHPANFNEVEVNIDKFINARSRSKTNWRLSACISISAFNVYYFFETFEHYVSKNIGTYINIVHDHRGSRIMPDKLKIKVVEHLNKFRSSVNDTEWQKEKDMVCNHLTNSEFDETAWRQFIEEIKLRDALRNESFGNVFPEYWDLIKEFI